MLGIVGLIAAIAVLIIGAFKGLGPLPLTIIAAFVAMITNNVGLWEGYSGSYMAGYAGAYTSYFLIFAFSALYAKVMEESGSASAIGFKFIDWFGKKYVLLICILITSLLTYGGVSLFVCIFATGPIMFMLLKEANLPRHLAMAAFVMGTCTYNDFFAGKSAADKYHPDTVSGNNHDSSTGSWYCDIYCVICFMLWLLSETGKTGPGKR